MHYFLVDLDGRAFWVDLVEDLEDVLLEELFLMVRDGVVRGVVTRH
jgi:hypothetical protein